MSDLARLEERLTAAESKLAKLPKPSETPKDPAYVNVPMSRRPSIETDIRKYRAISEAERDVEHLKARIAYAKRTAPVPYSAEELKAARAVRTSSGWHRVAKVNAKSVTVETGYSWTDRYALDKILEVKI